MSRPSSGFTLIELLVVVLIIGVLASIAIPKFAGVKTKTNVTTMKTDLRNLITAQESYLAGSMVYYDGPIPAAGLGFTSSSGVTLTLLDVSASGWAATATHASAPAWVCAVFVGSA
ncbi:MAG: prepilin-type N-terminal cleavage/methylation domain-containing protein, partial [Gemmatimonadota bacterium]|nr:prepilin-type N-terminal cleavage/methylation domain-containing protein [Gemmatimonadota bacterium]